MDVGYAARVAPAGLELLTLSSFAGPFGVLAASGEPVAEGAAADIPGHRGACELAGLAHVAARTSDETKVLALAGRSASGETVLWLANLTADDVTASTFSVRLGRTTTAITMTPYGDRPNRLNRHLSVFST